MRNLPAEIGPGSKIVTDPLALNDRRWSRAKPENRISTYIRRLTPTPGCQETKIRSDDKADRRSAYPSAGRRGRFSFPPDPWNRGLGSQDGILAENDTLYCYQRSRSRRLRHTTHAAMPAEMADIQRTYLNLPQTGLLRNLNSPRSL